MNSDKNSSQKILLFTLLSMKTAHSVDRPHLFKPESMKTAHSVDRPHLFKPESMKTSYFMDKCRLSFDSVLESKLTPRINDLIYHNLNIFLFGSFIHIQHMVRIILSSWYTPRNVIISLP